MIPVLAPFAAIYGKAAGARSAAYRGGWLNAGRLARPVVSVGNLTAGGAGKTPLVALLAKLLLERGVKPAILTRGYRRDPGPSLIAIDPAPARSADPRKTGDEPAWLARELPDVPIVISADRYRAGAVAEQRYRVDVHLLDDGFQHLKLWRNVDVVAIDATQPLSDRALFPAGRQREPCAALKRAHFVVLTRSDQADAAPLEAQIREIAPQARSFRAHAVLRGWTDIAKRCRLEPDALRGRPLYAFCGIGNPTAFFSGLERDGFDVRGKRAFRDHHVYSGGEVARLLSCARQTNAALVTTEKDAMNLPHSQEGGFAAFACRIAAEISDVETLMESLITML